RQIAINGHIKFNLTIPLQQLNGLETLVIIMVANKYAFLQITRRRFLNEWEAFKKVISRRNIRRRITIPLTLSNLKLLRRITRTENILHRNFTRRQVAIQNRVASNIGISLTITSIILIKLIRVSLGTVRHPRRFKIVVIDIQITLKQMLRDFIGIRVNRAKKSGMVNITSTVNSRERSGINTMLHELNPLFTINVTMRDIKSKNVYSRVNSKATTQWRKTESANGVHLEGVASDNRSS